MLQTIDKLKIQAFRRTPMPRKREDKRRCQRGKSLTGVPYASQRSFEPQRVCQLLKRQAVGTAIALRSRRSAARSAGRRPITALSCGVRALWRHDVEGTIRPLSGGAGSGWLSVACWGARRAIEAHSQNRDAKIKKKLETMANPKVFGSLSLRRAVARLCRAHTGASPSEAERISMRSFPDDRCPGRAHASNIPEHGRVVSRHELRVLAYEAIGGTCHREHQSLLPRLKGSRGWLPVARVKCQHVVPHAHTL